MVPTKPKPKSEQALIERISPRSIEPYLRTAAKIGVMHNEDDVILAPGEIEYFEEVFGPGVKIYPPEATAATCSTSGSSRTCSISSTIREVTAMKVQIRKNILRILAAMLMIAILSSCAARQVKQEPAPLRPTSEYLDPRQEYVVKRVSDPWEGYNRNMYKFNAKFDKYVYLPVVNTYRVIFPPFVRDDVSNFFNNVGELDNLTNSILQLKAKKTGITAGRIVMNTISASAALSTWPPPPGWSARTRISARLWDTTAWAKGRSSSFPFWDPPI